MLQRKAQLQGNRNAGLSTLERSSLLQKRTLAERRQDYAEVEEIDAQLAQHAANAPEPARNVTADLLARVNERNRKANMESVRKAELQEAERKRRERKLAQSGGISAPIDPSARLKITPRTFNSNTPTGTRLVILSCWLTVTDIKQTWHTVCARREKRCCCCCCAECSVCWKGACEGNEFI